MMRIGTLREVKPGDEIAGDFAGHLYVMRIDHVVYSTFDVDDAVEHYMRDNGLTEPELRTNLVEENGMGKWQFESVSDGTVLLIGERKELHWGGTMHHGYMNTDTLVMIHTPEK